jgi:hypothetical protein
MDGTSSKFGRKLLFGFLEQRSMSELIKLANVLKGFENVDKENVDEWLQSDPCEPDFQHMTDTDIISAVAKQNKEEKTEERGNSEHISRHVELQCFDTLLQYMG